MQFVELVHEAQLHRETYIAILKGVLHRPGDKQRLAQSVGITPQYLSNLLDPFNRLPSPELADKIANRLPLGKEQRENILEHMLLAHEQRLKMERAARELAHPGSLSNELDALERFKEAAIFATDFKRVEGLYRTVRAAGWALLQFGSLHHGPLRYAELCLWLSDIENILNVPGNALYLAKQARFLTSRAHPNELSLDERDTYWRLEFEALRAEAIALHNLTLYHQAYDLCGVAEQVSLVQYDPQTWLPHLYRDKINALSQKPRFSIREAESLVDLGKVNCDRSDHPHTGLWALMLERSLGEAYIQYGNLKKANRLLAAQADSLSRATVMGPLHRVLILSTYAEACRLQGDIDSWQSIMRDALAIAFEAGLAHQIAKTTAEYGSLLQPILAEFSTTASAV